MEHYIPILERKPGLLDSGKPFVKAAFFEAERLMRSELEYRYAEDGTRQFLNSLMLSKDHEFALVRQAISERRRGTVETICNYFTKHRHRMRYDYYLAESYPIASGVIEGA